MKKALITFAFILLIMAVQAQIKVHDDGHVSLASLTKAYGVQVRPNGYTYFHTQSDAEWGWATLSYANNMKQKHWIVDNPTMVGNTHPFFVTGNGWVYKSGSWRMSDNSLQSETSSVTDASAVLDSITGFWYVPVDGSTANSTTEKRLGVSAQEVERILPEAVTADENGLLYVDYEALTVFLIEAIKDQRHEIELLRKTLEENGLMKKQP
ncbi:MAG: hypothetical protein Q4F82_02920 [bacterium]|nr:hypothetical protein [bacterium]